MKKSLNVKINVLMIIVVTMFFSIFGSFDYMYSKKIRTEKLNSDLLNITNRLTQTLAIPIWDLDFNKMTNHILAEMLNKNIHTITVYDSNTNNVLISKTRNNEWQVVDLNDHLPTAQIHKTQKIIYNNITIASIKVQATDKFIKKEIISEA
ncbi:MAG: hypothetical protein KAR45_21340, partial [Desulfobacteraceae bacterium]|nr:hypothetical protein [Desulfobacteraceae bacterium]